MTRRGPSRRRLSGSLRRRQGSALRAAPSGADGLDHASREPTAGCYVMARLRDSVECRASKAGDAIENTNASRRAVGAISIEHCHDLLGHDGCGLSDEEIELIRRRAQAMAHILVDIFLQNSPTRDWCR
jgi:hypothetical protein